MKYGDCTEYWRGGRSFGPVDRGIAESFRGGGDPPAWSLYPRVWTAREIRDDLPEEGGSLTTGERGIDAWLCCGREVSIFSDRP